MEKLASGSHAQEQSSKRNSKLTPEERKARASAAAKAMWEKKRKAKVGASQADGSIPAHATGPAPAAPPIPEPPPSGRKVEAPPVPKEFSRALAVATKHYEKALEDLDFYQRMVAMLTARIPGLVQTIRVLGGVVAGIAESPNAIAMRGPEINYPPPDQPLPVIPVARGGSLGIINDARTEDENQFLRDSEGVGAGGGWA